jgi:biopolymer transport protein ExbB
MKKLFSLIAVLAFLMFGATNNLQAQEDVTGDTSGMTEMSTDTMDETGATTETIGEEMRQEKKEETLHQQIKSTFIQGGAGFMGSVLLCLILGLALAIERIIYLNLATTNTDKLLARIEDALNTGGVEAAKEVCRNTRGPVASIFYQGLDRSNEGIEMVEKSVISYGSVQMGLLERNLSWIALFIAIAPMLGFMGTVIGMISAFDSIEMAGDVSASLVAGGIKIALITTVGGLIVALILQVFYNYLVSKIDSLVNNMEDASISMIDLLVKHNLKNN